MSQNRAMVLKRCSTWSYHLIPQNGREQDSTLRFAPEAKFFFQNWYNKFSKWVMDTKNMDCIKKNGSTNYDLFIYNNSISSGYRNHYHFSCKCIFGHNLLNYIMLIHHFMDNAIIIKLLQNVSDYELLSSEWNINVSRMVNSIPS